MSRVAKNPITIPENVDLSINENVMGEFNHGYHGSIGTRN